MIDSKREHPSVDIFSTIVHAEFEADGSSLNDYELRSFFSLLFPAGAETTTRSISGGMLAFLEHPQQWQRLQADPAMIKSAVEEVVRWDNNRRCTSAVPRPAIPNCKIGIYVRAIKSRFWEMSANRDERIFERPFDFDIGRSPNKHIGFGAGVHFCLGAALARLELTIVFGQLVKSGLRIDLDGEPEWVPNNRLVGIKSLPVRVRPLD